MSAQAVFAIAAPVAPAAPHGPAGSADATGFAALLATAAEMGDGVGEASADLLTTTVDVETEATEAAEMPFMVTAAAPLVTLPPPPPAAAEASPPIPAAVPDLPAELAPAAPPVAVDASPRGSGTASAPAQSLASAADKNTPPAAPSQTAPQQTLAPEAVEAPPAPPPARPEAHDAAAAALPPLATPAPLRPLAERTSKPAEPTTSGAGESVAAQMSGPKDRASGSTTPPAAGLVADKAAGPAGGKSEVATAGPEVAGDAAASEAAPVGDSARHADAATTIARETGLSGLSRSTIEATAQIAAQILRRLEGRSTRFEMALLPEELGRVDIKLDIDSEGRLAARLAFDNPAAATDLRGRVDELRRQLEDAGFHLADDAFEFADRDSGSSAFDRGQDDRGGSRRAFAAAQRLSAEADAAIPPRWMALSLSPSGVDVKV
ncbi:MAG TPA: flagellar hook-length control protein FliK [Brevundimonas sp.]|uniref:flagellar hook-length control protein FliK n=1 Tax=Brevundimonas sp. TaxID=1871086 RepID=UPI002EDBAD55